MAKACHQNEAPVAKRTISIISVSTTLMLRYFRMIRSVLAVVVVIEHSFGAPLLTSCSAFLRMDWRSDARILVRTCLLWDVEKELAPVMYVSAPCWLEPPYSFWLATA